MAEELDMNKANVQGGAAAAAAPAKCACGHDHDHEHEQIMTMTMNRAAFVRAATMRFPAAWGMTGRWGGFSSRCWVAS